MGCSMKRPGDARTSRAGHERLELPMQTATYRRCPTCRAEKSLEDFHCDRSDPQGRTARCASCRNSYALSRRELTAEERHDVRRERGLEIAAEARAGAWRQAQQVDAAFGHWLAGFTDGEGYFGVAIDRRTSGINAGHSFPIVRFAVNQHTRDRQVIDWIAETLGFGRVDCTAGGRLTQFRVIRQADMEIVAELFTLYPLHTAKTEDFDIWCSALRIKRSMLNGGSAQGNLNREAWIQFEAAADEMRDLRESRLATSAAMGGTRQRAHSPIPSA